MIGPVFDIGAATVAFPAADEFLCVGAVPDATRLEGEIERDRESTGGESAKNDPFSCLEAHSSCS